MATTIRVQSIKRTMSFENGSNEKRPGKAVKNKKRMKKKKKKTTTYLWSQIIGCPTKRPSGRCAQFGETKVCDLDVSIKVEKDVFWFKISVNDVQ